MPRAAIGLGVLLFASVSYALATGQVQKLWREPAIEPARLVPYGAAEPDKSRDAAPHRELDMVASGTVANTGASTSGEWGTGATPVGKPATKPVAKPTPATPAKPPKPAPVATNHAPAPHGAARPDVSRGSVRIATGADEPASPRISTVTGEAPMTAVRPGNLDHAPVESLYRAAHELHFHGSDAQAALDAWDRYLAVEPTGRFAVEARYNRALCLVRLARYDEARDALGPYARGEIEPAGYREDDAKALVDRIDARKR